MQKGSRPLTAFGGELFAGGGKKPQLQFGLERQCLSQARGVWAYGCCIEGRESSSPLLCEREGLPPWMLVLPLPLHGHGPVPRPGAPAG